jgi:hypothetical protein
MWVYDLRSDGLQLSRLAWAVELLGRRVRFDGAVYQGPAWVVEVRNPEQRAAKRLLLTPAGFRERFTPLGGSGER